MSSTVTVEELLSRITGVRQNKLHSPCVEKHLWNVAKKLSQWRVAAPLLGFGQADVDAWEHDARHDEEGKRHLMLTKWQQKKGSQATYKALAEVLLRVDRTDLAESLLVTLKDAPPEANGSPHVFSSPPLPHSFQNTRRFLTPNYSHQSHFRQGTSLSSPCPTQPQPFSISSTPFYTACNSETASPYGTRSPHPPVNTEEQQYMSWGRGLPQPMGCHVAIPEASVTSTSSATQGSTGEYCGPHLIQRVDVVCQQGSMAGLPSENTMEMQRLKNRVQQLELELRISKNRHEREITHLKMEQEFERREHRRMVQLLQQQLEANARHFQSRISRHDATLCHKEAHFHNFEGIDGAPAVGENLQRVEQQDYRKQKSIVYELRKEITATLEVSSADSSDQHMTYKVTCTEHEVFEKVSRTENNSVIRGEEEEGSGYEFTSLH